MAADPVPSVSPSEAWLLARYHRHRDPESIGEGFIFIATRLLLFSMFPLMVALGLEFFLIARMITNSLALSIVLALVVMTIFSTLWFLLPRNKTLKTALQAGFKQKNNSRN